MAAGDHRARVFGRERDAAEGHLAVGEDLRLRASDDLTQPGMVELAGHAEALRKIAAGHRDDVEAVDGQDVVERIDAGRRLDQHDAQDGVVRGSQIVEIREPPAERRVRRTVPALSNRRVAYRLHRGLGLLTARNLRKDHAERAAVEHGFDELRARGRHADDRRGRRAAGRGHHRGDRLDADRRVLGVEHQPVDASPRQRLHDLDAWRRDQIAERGPAFGEASPKAAELIERSGHAGSQAAARISPNSRPILRQDSPASSLT
jgi:hypothetical protein